MAELAQPSAGYPRTLLWLLEQAKAFVHSIAKMARRRRTASQSASGDEFNHHSACGR
jgi:hypothetical protein